MSIWKIVVSDRAQPSSIDWYQIQFHSSIWSTYGWLKTLIIGISIKSIAEYFCKVVSNLKVSQPKRKSTKYRKMVCMRILQYRYECLIAISFYRKCSSSIRIVLLLMLLNLMALHALLGSLLIEMWSFIAENVISIYATKNSSKLPIEWIKIISDIVYNIVIIL